MISDSLVRGFFGYNKTTWDLVLIHAANYEDISQENLSADRLKEDRRKYIYNKYYDFKYDEYYGIVPVRFEEWVDYLNTKEYEREISNWRSKYVF